MNMKKMIVSMAIIIALVLTVSLTYAWFTMVETTQPIIFNTGSLTADLKLYQGLDINDDQLIDEYQEVTETIAFENVIPGMKYYFRINVKNAGSIDGNLDLLINEIIYSDFDFLNGFTISFIDPKTSELKVISFSDYQEGLSIFESFLLAKNENVDFDFTIHINRELINDGNLKITSFAVKLEQIH